MAVIDMNVFTVVDIDVNILLAVVNVYFIPRADIVGFITGIADVGFTIR